MNPTPQPSSGFNVEDYNTYVLFEHLNRGCIPNDLDELLLRCGKRKPYLEAIIESYERTSDRGKAIENLHQLIAGSPDYQRIMNDTSLRERAFASEHVFAPASSASPSEDQPETTKGLQETDSSGDGLADEVIFDIRLNTGSLAQSQAEVLGTTWVDRDDLDEEIDADDNMTESSAFSPIPVEPVGAVEGATQTARSPFDGFDGSPSGGRWSTPRLFDEGDVIPDQFDFNLLPSTLRTWVLDISERMQVPPDFVAVAMMVAAGSAIGRKLVIRPKRFDNWSVVCNLWAGLVAEPGTMKTPALRQGLHALRLLEKEAAAQYQEEHRIWKAQVERLKRERKARAKVQESGQDIEDTSCLSEVDPPEPVCRRFILNEATYQSLHKILSENPNGVLCELDELSALQSAFKNPSQTMFRQLLLESWNGDSPRASDTLSRGTQRADHMCLSLIGTIQPGVLRSIFKDGIEGGAMDDGFLQRLQLTVWPVFSQEFQYIDRIPDRKARQEAEDTIRYLAGLDPYAVGAQHDEDGNLPYLRFEDAALQVFLEWYTNLEERLRTEKMPPAFRAHLGKYRSLLPSLALIHHLAEHRTGPVTLESAQAGLAWVTYLETHARRIYNFPTQAERSARNLYSKLVEGVLSDGFSARDVYINRWSGLTNNKEAETALRLLIKLGWLRSEKVSTGGRPTERYFIHPLLAKSK